MSCSQVPIFTIHGHSNAEAGNCHQADLLDLRPEKVDFFFQANFRRQTGDNSCSSTAATKRAASFMDKRPLWSDELSKYLEVSKRVKLVCQLWLHTCCLKLSIESASIQVSTVLWWQTWQRFEFSASSSSSATARWSKKGFSPENFNLIPDAAAGNVSPVPNDFEISVWHPSGASSLMAG